MEIAPLPGASLEATAKPAAPTRAESDLLVTGSRIKRSTFAQPSAVSVVGREEIERSGAATPIDLIRRLDINSGSLGGEVVAFNLRGLGVNSNLVLLNGRRIVSAGTSNTEGASFVDINSFPVGAIERIEILKGGASAIYGADAIAGVVNIITRKNFHGAKAQIGGQATDTFDQGEFDVSLAAGARGERMRLSGIVSYLRREPLAAEERDFTKNGRNTSSLGWPSTFLALRPAPPMGLGRFPFRDPGCGDSEFPGSIPNDDPRSPLPFCAIDFNSYTSLVGSEQRFNTYGNAEVDLGSHATLYLETLYARNRSQRPQAPSFPLLQNVIVPADHMYNPTGYPLRWYGRLLGGNSPPLIARGESDTVHTAAGIKGDFGGIARGVALLEDWEWQLGTTWSANQFVSSNRDVLTDQLQLGLNNCKPADDPARCWNPFSFGAPNSTDLLNTLLGEQRTVVNTELMTASLDFSGPLAVLPGGDLAIAVGAQVRRESTKLDSDHNANRENFAFFFGGPDYQAQRKIASVYAELSLPFVRGLELQAASRLEHYEEIGATFNPMAGVSWVPATTFVGDGASLASQVRIRGTFATSFRAPSLLQSAGRQTSLEELYSFTNVDGRPMQSATATYLAVRSTGNPDLEPQTSRAVTIGAEWSPVHELSLMTDYWNIDYTDIIVRENARQIMEADFRCNVVNAPEMCDPRIVRSPDGIAQAVNTSYMNAQSVETHGLDFGVTYRSKLFGPDAGNWRAGVTGSYTFAYRIPAADVGPVVREQVADCDSETCDIAGLRNFANFSRPLPRMRMTIPIGWDQGVHSATAILRFVAGYRDDLDSDPAADRQDFRDVDPWLTLDLQYEAKLDEGDGYTTAFRFGILNAFDSDPPTLNAALGYDIFTHDPRGRMFYVRVAQEM